MSSFCKLVKEYSKSGIAAFIADEKLNILWKNNIGGMCAELGESAGVIFDSGVPDTGLTVKEIGGSILTFNVIKAYDDGNDKLYYIIELISSRKLGGTVSAESVRGYIGCVLSKLRAAAENIISAADRLLEDSSGNAFSAAWTACFERIRESAAMLEREVFFPDRLYALAASEKPDDTIMLDRELNAVVSELKSIMNEKFGGKVRISEDYDRDIFFRMNADSFETAVASMAAECGCGGLYPERIIFSARRSGRDRAEISVMSLYIGRDTAANKDARAYEPEKSFNRRLLSEYIYDVLSLKNGARFSKENLPYGFVCRMNIEALPKRTSVLAEKPVDGSGRQRDIMYKLAFFFGDIPDSERQRYMSPDLIEGGENGGEQKGLDFADL